MSIKLHCLVDGVTTTLRKEFSDSGCAFVAKAPRQKNTAQADSEYAISYASLTVRQSMKFNYS